MASGGIVRLLPLLALFACRGTVAVVADGDPAIAVVPDHVVFPLTEAGATSTGTIRIENVGDAALDVTGLSVDGPAFRIVDADVSALLPGEQAEVTVAYEPRAAQDEGVLVVSSNDPATPSVPVRFSGEGAFPELAIAPALLDFGYLPDGCRSEQPVVLTNAGRATLVIDTLAQEGDGFSIASQPTLPLSLAPGEAEAVTLAFDASGPRDHAGELIVLSNEPAGSRTATQTAVVAPPKVHTEDFRQLGDWQGVDVILWVDGSGSMVNHQAALAAHLGVFTTALDELEPAWRIIAVDDSGCGAMITTDTADDWAYAAAVERGSGWEAGLAIARTALQETGSGGCNEGFLRPDAKTLIVLASDEPEQSGIAWNELVDDILAWAPSATISAIAGDLPSGCSSAAAGYGYAEAATATGGEFLSICDADWGASLEAIATTASIAVPMDTFRLSAMVAADTLQVTVDGAPAELWTFDEAQHAVVFATPPVEGAAIVVTYAEPPVCD